MGRRRRARPTYEPAASAGARGPTLRTAPVASIDRIAGRDSGRPRRGLSPRSGSTRERALARRPRSCSRIPPADRASRSRSFALFGATPRGRDGLAPSGGAEPGDEIGQRRQHEEALAGARVRDGQPLRVVAGRVPLTGAAGAPGGILAASLRRPLHPNPMAPEDEEVQVERARAPARPLATPERALEPLERDQQRERTRGGVGTDRDVERHDGVAKLGLVDDADRCRGVEPRDAGQPGARHGGEAVDRGRQGASRVADVRPQPDVRARPSQPAASRGTVSGMPPVFVRILHAKPGPQAGPLERALIAARAELAERHRHGFQAVGAADVRIIAGPPDDLSFGARLRDIAAEAPENGAGGIVVLGSGAVPLATRGDRRAFVVAAAGSAPAALANNVYSADIVAIAGSTLLRDLRKLPDLPSDNALPRWLAEVAEVPVTARDRWRLAIDLDSPLDLLLLGRAADVDRPDAAGVTLDAVTARLAGIRAILANRRAELVVAGRTSAGTLRALERGSACRVRAFVEERGLRASSPLALGAGGGGEGRPTRRPPRSSLGLLVDRDGPAALGALLAELGDGAVVDTRVLMAHRWGADERGWPRTEDRFAADLLLPDRIADPWLRALVRGLRDASIPVLAGGHTLVGPGIRLLAARTAGPGATWATRPAPAARLAPTGRPR